VDGVPIGHSGWSGYRTADDVYLVAWRDGVDGLVSKIVEYVRNTELELKNSPANKIVPRDAFDIWDEVMTGLRDQEVQWKVEDAGTGRPLLSFNDYAGRRFELGSEPPVPVKVDGRIFGKLDAYIARELHAADVVSKIFKQKTRTSRFSLNATQTDACDQLDDYGSPTLLC
jgi:hypothetical protein